MPFIPADGSSFTYAAAALFTDPDPGEVLRYSIAGNDRPEIFRSLTVDTETGVLSVEWLPYADILLDRAS